MFLFPYGRISKGSSVALYGAGRVGQDFFSQIVQTDYCSLAVWVDKDFLKYRNQYLPVYPCECLRSMNFDYVIISIKNGKVVCNIKDDLILNGISEEKIVWEYEAEEACLWKAQELYQGYLNTEFSINRKVEKKVFWLVNTPNHGNLGDHAIAIAEKRFLKKLYPEYTLHILTSKMIDRYLFLFEKVINHEDIIFITGGGFMGTLWIEEDSRVQTIIQRFPNNKIIFFPQTFYYDKNDSEKVEIDHHFYTSRKKNILFFHREKYSYFYFTNNILKEYKNIFCEPDMALYLYYEKKENSKDVLLCLRDDKESLLSEQDKKIIYHDIHNLGFYIKKTDTVYDFEIEVEKQEGFLEYKLNEFLSSEIVITDRLHGMIFSYITGTPCIVLSQVSHKCEGVYQWIRKCENIILEKNIYNLSADIRYLQKKKKKEINLNTNFLRMKKEIDQFIKG